MLKTTQSGGRRDMATVEAPLAAEAVARVCRIGKDKHVLWQSSFTRQIGRLGDLSR